MIISNVITWAIGILGAIGGAAGFISIYKARSEKTSIDIENLQNVVREYEKLYKDVKDDYDEYKKDTTIYIDEFKERFNSLEARCMKIERCIVISYRCKFPPKGEECPIVSQYESLTLQCENNNQQD